MSGFLAIVSESRPDTDLVERMLLAGAHRGPVSVWQEPGVLLAGYANRRGVGTAVADDFAVAVDLRVDDRDALLRELGVSAATSDAEVFLHAWRRWGLRALHRILGDFSGAVWDRRERRLVVVRDPVGSRPAFLSRAGARMIAASEIRMILADERVDRRIDDAWVAGFVALQGDFTHMTGYEAVKRLPAGRLAEARDSAWRERKWHSWSWRRTREADDRAYAERLRELLRAATRDRLSGVRRAGIALSGGLDSTSVAAVASSQRLGGLVALSIPFEDPKGDERHLQRAAADMSRMSIRWVSLEGRGAFGTHPDEIFEVFGEPPRAPNWFQADAVAAAAADEEATVVLDGIDADSLLAGHTGFLSDLAVTGRWRTYRREARDMMRVHGAGAKWILKDQTIRPLVPTPLWRLVKRASGRPSQVPGFLSAEFARRHRLERLLEWEPWRPGRLYWALERMAVSPRMLASVLEELNIVYARHGVEVAHPFLDRRVVEFCLGLPREQKLTGGYTKVVLRRAMTGLLPQEILSRPGKANLSLPFSAGLYGFLKEAVQEGLRSAMANPSPWFEAGALRTLASRFDQGHDAFDAFRVACVARWRDRDSVIPSDDVPAALA